MAKQAAAAHFKNLPASAPSALGLDPTKLANLAEVFKGQLVFPGEASYELDRQDSNPAFQAFPLLIAYCAAITDVALILGVARDSGVKVACRSGGHSTAGYSVNDDIVLDTSRMNDVVVTAAAKTATVGPGTAFEKLNATFDSYHLHVPGGGCPDVCVCGYMQGGGYGFTSREFGMHCDNVLAVLVMLVDGSIVAADANQHSDLFWAIRGGTGNNFGVLLQTTYRLHDLWQIQGFGPTVFADARCVRWQRCPSHAGPGAAAGHAGHAVRHPAAAELVLPDQHLAAGDGALDHPVRAAAAA